MSETNRVTVSAEDAERMLPRKENVHTFRQSGPVLIGADWERDKLMDWIREHGCELSGEQATAMSHGLVGFDNRGPMFIETEKNAQVGLDPIALGM